VKGKLPDKGLEPPAKHRQHIHHDEHGEKQFLEETGLAAGIRLMVLHPAVNRISGMINTNVVNALASFSVFSEKG
jgi:hypothetical protein